MKNFELLSIVFFISQFCDLSNCVLNGYPIEIQNAPYMVRIQTIIDPQVSSTQAASCGGSFIRERIQRVVGSNGVTRTKYAKFVLTAAHCLVIGDDLHTAAPGDVTLIYGTTELTQVQYNNFISGVRQVHIHPQYVGGEPLRGNDAAILELNDEVTLDGATSRAISLNSSPYFPPGTQTRAAGWGTNPNNPGSTHLYQAQLDVYSYSECAKSYSTEESLRQKQICALGPPPDYASLCKVSGDFLKI